MSAAPQRKITSTCADMIIDLFNFNISWMPTITYRLFLGIAKHIGTYGGYYAAPHATVHIYNCCCVVVGTLSWPWMSVGRLRHTALVRCDLCVNGGGVLADVCGASDVWCTAL